MINASTMNVSGIMEMIWEGLSDIQRLTNSLNAKGLGVEGGENSGKNYGNRIKICVRYTVIHTLYLSIRWFVAVTKKKIIFGISLN
jgi:hypothetical protein